VIQGKAVEGKENMYSKSRQLFSVGHGQHQSKVLCRTTNTRLHRARG